MIEKRGFKFDMGEDFFLVNSGFPMKGHTVEIPLTEEDREAHARAKAAIDEVNSNDWVALDGYDYELYLRTLEPRTEFVPEETLEEWKARWIAAGRPDYNAQLWVAPLNFLDTEIP